jgi:RNA polymerase sigma factor (sigma-70 family)
MLPPYTDKEIRSIVMSNYGLIIRVLSRHIPFDYHADVQHDIVIRLMEALKKYKGYSDCSLSTYVYKVAKYTACDWYRKHCMKRYQDENIIFYFTAQQKLEEQTLHNTTEIEQLIDQGRYLLRQWIESLPPKDQYIFQHRYIYGKRITVIASELDTERNKLNVRLHRLRNQFKKLCINHFNL